MLKGNEWIRDLSGINGHFHTHPPETNGLNLKCEFSRETYLFFSCGAFDSFLPSQILGSTACMVWRGHHPSHP